jgi:hypothetical protein
VDSRPHRHLLRGQNCTVVHTDVPAFGEEQRNDGHREIIRRSISDMTRLALHPIWQECRCEDRGDGHLIVASPDIPTEQVLERLLNVLPAELRRHNDIHSKPVQIQLRISVDVGPIIEDAMGVSGNSIIRTTRMIDAPAFRQAIAETGSLLGIIVSPFVYDTAIKNGRGSVDPASYTEVHVKVKETSMSGWMQLIGPPQPREAQPREAQPREPLMRPPPVGDLGRVPPLLPGVGAAGDPLVNH